MDDRIVGQLEGALSMMRSNGWTVAVHNDYRLHDRPHTFWLFTHSATGKFVQGEGHTDIDALGECLWRAGLK